ncbi:MAG: hypothetical protein KGI08_02755, partial [Thaumarchaeota archaeon]|nr:hypothetical protein [Nitrososphaerota archaeon]
LADLRFESGLLYQVPLMERFIPLNKTQDIVITRLEKWINTMVTGIYMVRKGENMVISNIPGGQKVEYEGTPPAQMQIGNVGATPFQFMEMTNKYIEEQGISSNQIQNLPSNIANNTIENIQQQEFTNLKFAIARLKACVTRIGELCIERADKEFVKPQEISYKEDQNVQYFSVIGSRGAKIHKEVDKKLPRDIVTLNRKLKIRVEADTGFGLTQEGRRKAMSELMNTMVEFYKLGFLGSGATALLVKRYVEEYGYGSTEEFMEAIDKGITQGQMSQQQIMQMKVAIAQVLKDTKSAGPAMNQQLVDSTKLGVAQVMKDTGLLDKLGAEGKDNIEVDNLVKLYKDASPDLRRQIEQKLGLQPATDEPISPSQSTTAKNLHEIVKGNNDMKVAQQNANKPEEPQNQP